MIQGTRKQKTEPILGTGSRNGDSQNKQVTTPSAVSHTFPFNLRLSANIPGFVSVDLIGENNQVILEYSIYLHKMTNNKYIPTCDVFSINGHFCHFCFVNFSIQAWIRD